VKQNSTGHPATDPTATFAIPTALRGQVGKVIFRLTLLTPVLKASRLNWLGGIEAPNGIAGITAGQLGVPAQVLFPGWTSSTVERGTGLSESGLDVQGYFANRHAADTILVTAHKATGRTGIGLIQTIPGADQLGRNGEEPLTSDRHAVEPQEDSQLIQVEDPNFSQAVMNENAAVHAPISQHGALVDNSAVTDIANDDIGGDLPSKGRNGTSANLEVLNLEEVSLLRLEPLSLSLESTERGLNPPSSSWPVVQLV